ncbi:hypothetical protein [Devosia ginsengisoli]|uniref:Uncharacterized protein n=1 Tax=Devosia ginsengisoli TaxID=400770 RepID=A0A5B8LRZ1_9HYPH|nr:hypothetical protein [Devosia ginsengisoli]QDZ10641.1 hypothetical protein FPZ08_07675 [Devosia ginsengisoli]
MTTIKQVRSWTAPLLDTDSRLVLIGRNLVIKPVRHFARGVYVDRTGDRLRPRLLFYADPLFAVPSGQSGFVWSRLQSCYKIDQEGFEADFLANCRLAIEELSRIDTIFDFLEATSKIMGRPLGPVPIYDYPVRYAIVLIALGRFEEALSILNNDASGANSAAVQHGPAEELGALVQATRALGRPAIADLLRKQEEQKAKVWGVDHLWEKTRFPFEEH